MILHSFVEVYYVTMQSAVNTTLYSCILYTVSVAGRGNIEDNDKLAVIIDYCVLVILILHVDVDQCICSIMNGKWTVGATPSPK